RAAFSRILKSKRGFSGLFADGGSARVAESEANFVLVALGSGARFALGLLGRSLEGTKATHFVHDAFAFHFTFESLESAIDRLAFFDFDFGHGRGVGVSGMGSSTCGGRKAGNLGGQGRFVKGQSASPRRESAPAETPCFPHPKGWE